MVFVPIKTIKIHNLQNIYEICKFYVKYENFKSRGLHTLQNFAKKYNIINDSAINICKEKTDNIIYVHTDRES